MIQGWLNVGRKYMLSQSKSVYIVNLFSKYLLALLQGWKTKKTKSKTAAYATDGNIKRTTITLFNSFDSQC